MYIRVHGLANVYVCLYAGMLVCVYVCTRACTCAWPLGSSKDLPAATRAGFVRGLARLKPHTACTGLSVVALLLFFF